MNNLLTVSEIPERIEIRRKLDGHLLVAQNVAANHRPFLHPLSSPAGRKILTENAPFHHPWQHGIYVGLNDVNGVGFWTEGLLPESHKNDGTFHPRICHAGIGDVPVANWSVECEWRDKSGSPLLTEQQHWSLADKGAKLVLDLQWTLTARIDLRFGQYSYGGLFVRMPFSADAQATALNANSLKNQEGEGQRSAWVAVALRPPESDHFGGIAMLAHPSNLPFPPPWRIDDQFGFGPARCIAGAWRLTEGESAQERYRLIAFDGDVNAAVIDTEWAYYQSS